MEQFCSHCGAPLCQGVKFCSQCGAPVSGDTLLRERKPYTLTIIRDKQMMVVDCKIKVQIDMEEPFKLSNGERKEIILPDGIHHIKFSAYFRSTNIDVDLHSDASLMVEYDRLSGKIAVKMLHY